MAMTSCFLCGTEIEEKGIHFRGQVFCGDECCEEYEARFAAKGGPGAEDLEDSEAADGFEGTNEADVTPDYDEDDPTMEKRPDDDDFDIELDDF